MLKTNRLVITEGKYDKIKLESVLDALIVTTDGFSIFKDKKKTEFIKEYAKNNGILIITDSDSAGFKIRNYISSVVPSEYILNAYIPDVFGKEKRKEHFSSEGKLGVEGMDNKAVIEALMRSGIEEKGVGENHTISYDLYKLGLYGKPNSKHYRQKLISHINLPERISKNSLLKYINRNFTKEEFENIIKELEEKDV